MFYYAFGAKEVVQIIKDSSKQYGVYAKKCHVLDYPMNDDEKGIMVGGELRSFGNCHYKSAGRVSALPTYHSAAMD
jgi:hypothetical protein